MNSRLEEKDVVVVGGRAEGRTGMRIFVAGATGVMGRRVVPSLVRAGHRVTAIGRSEGAREELERAGARPVALDLFNASAVREAVADHDVVINLATSIPPISRIFLPGAWRANDRIRSQASANLVEAALAGGATRYIQESFAPIYPDGGDQWIDESVSPQPASYNRSVLAAEAAAGRFTQAGRTGVALRFAFFYGPDSPLTLEMIRYVRRGWASIFGAPDAFYSSLSHDDAAAAVLAALDMPAGIYNVADDEPLRRRELVDSLAGELGVRPPRLLPRWTAKLAGSLGQAMARSLRISNRKLKAESAWAPMYPSMREGWQAVLSAVQEGNQAMPVH
jgi:nucleoside-diphosphate-sugar epimerase